MFRHPQFWAIYRIPAILALITFIGLLSGVLGDGIWDAVSWLGLGIPIAVVCWFVLRHSSGRWQRMEHIRGLKK
jgi:hypothetical protein